MRGTANKGRRNANRPSKVETRRRQEEDKLEKNFASGLPSSSPLCMRSLPRLLLLLLQLLNMISGSLLVSHCVVFYK